MFVAYSDCSIQNGNAYLGFLIVFEDGSKVRRRIVYNESNNNNKAEAIAFWELVSFLDFYNFTNGVILYDSEYVKKRLKKRWRKKYFKTRRRTLNDLQVHTQIISRRYNKAHKICYKGRFLKSRDVSKVNRNVLPILNGYPDHYIQLSAFEDYKRTFNEHNIAFHNVLQKVNEKIWSVGNLEVVGENFNLYSVDGIWIKVHKNTIVKICKENPIINQILGGENHKAINQQHRILSYCNINLQGKPIPLES